MSASSGWWECSCGTRLNAVQCPHCQVADVVQGLDVQWQRCVACGKATEDHPLALKSDAGAYADTLKWRGLTLGKDDQAIIFCNRVISVSGVDLPLNTVVSLAVSAGRITFAGIGADGVRITAGLRRRDLIDLRIELREEDLIASSSLSRFTVLGAGVGKAISGLVNTLTGQVELSETVITVASEMASVVLTTSEVTPEEADALMVGVELDVSANRKRIIDAAPHEPEDDDLIELLADLMALRESGVLTEREFAAKKAEILDRI